MASPAATRSRVCTRAARSTHAAACHGTLTRVYPPHHAGLSVDTHGPQRPGATLPARLAIPTRACAANQNLSTAGCPGSERAERFQNSRQNCRALACTAATVRRPPSPALNATGSGALPRVVTDVRTVETTVATGAEALSVKLIACPPTTTTTHTHTYQRVLPSANRREATAPSWAKASHAKQ